LEQLVLQALLVILVLSAPLVLLALLVLLDQLEQSVTQAPKEIQVPKATLVRLDLQESQVQQALLALLD